MEEKKIYIGGAVMSVVLLIVITGGSLFFTSPKEITVNNKPVETPIKPVVEVQSQDSLEIMDFASENIEEERYSISVYKPSKLPSPIQKEVDAIYKRVKEELINSSKNGATGEKYSLESPEPGVYKSDKYVSLVMEFKKSTPGSEKETEYVSLTYKRDGNTIVSLNDVLENDNRDNEIYEYLSSYLESVLVNSLVMQAQEKGISSDANKESLKKLVKVGLTPSAENFSIWYVDGKSITFIFPPYKVAPLAYGKQEASVYLNTAISSIKSYKKE
jgi:hypothetical protein